MQRREENMSLWTGTEKKICIEMRALLAVMVVLLISCGRG